MVQRDDDGGVATTKGFSGGWPVPAKTCDSCKLAPALLFCRADSAFLCLACDGKVHGANKLASRHERVWMCEVCEQAPASVTCKADAAALCVSCDADIHSANPLAHRHERFPVVPFFEPASAALIKSSTASLLHSCDDDDDDNNNVNPVPKDNQDHDDALTGRDEAEAASWLLPNPNVNSKMIEAPEFKASDFFFSDVDPYLDLDYGSPMEPRFGMQNSAAMDSVVPVSTKPISPFPPHLPPSSDPQCFDAADYCRPKPCYNYTTPSLSHSVSSSSLDVGVVPDGTDISYGGSVKSGMDIWAGGPGQLMGLDREARVLRYREKRKNRKFEKTIRYASRKAYAETRPRIKGRFAKRTEVEGGMDRIYSSAAAMMADTAGYGVVPSF